MRDRRKQPSIAVYHRFGPGLDLDSCKRAVWTPNYRVNCVVIHQRQIDVETVFEHSADNPIFNSFAKPSAVSKRNGHLPKDTRKLLLALPIRDTNDDGCLSFAN